MYHLRNIKKFYILHTYCIYVFCVSHSKYQLWTYTALADCYL